MSSRNLVNIVSKSLRCRHKVDTRTHFRRHVKRFHTEIPSQTTSQTLKSNISFPNKILNGQNVSYILKNSVHTSVDKVLENDLSCIQSNEDSVGQTMHKDMIIINDFITEEEEQRIVDEVEPYLKRMRYESSHWDDAIHSYRETERKQWREINKPVIQRIRDVAFPKHVSQLSLVHILDLSKDGYIKAHVDAVRFCGNTIAGLSLLSSAVMRLVHTDNSSKHADILLKRRSLYIMREDARYKYTHEVLRNEDSFFKDQPVPRDRRIAVICRNEPE